MRGHARENKRVPIADGQEPLLSPDEADTTVSRHPGYYCRSCGSPNLTGLQPSTDLKGRWMIADQCNGCGKAKVIAERG